MASDTVEIKYWVELDPEEKLIIDIFSIDRDYWESFVDKNYLILGHIEVNHDINLNDINYWDYETNE